MWADANLESKVGLKDLEITEMSLTGNMPLSEMKERQIKWRTVDDATDKAGVLDYGSDLTQIKLEPMRIRVFKIV